MVEEQRLFAASALREISIERVRRLPAERNLPLFAPLAAYAQPSFAAVEIVEVQSDKLADADAAAVEQLQDRQIAGRMRPLEFARGDTIQQRVGLLGGHHVGQLLGTAWRAQQTRRVHRRQAFAQQETEEHTQRSELAADGDHAQLLIV